jgi:hypothetical protein
MKSLADFEDIARELTTPAALADLFATTDSKTRRDILARPAVRDALWRSEAGALRTRALREAC